jgi:hypothetical protein
MGILVPGRARFRCERRWRQGRGLHTARHGGGTGKPDGNFQEVAALHRISPASCWLNSSEESFAESA